MGNHRTMTRLCLTGAFQFAFLTGAAAFAGSQVRIAALALMKSDPP